MTIQPLNVLVFGEEYLIALDIQTVLTDQLGCTVAILPTSRFAQALQTMPFDVVLISLSHQRTVNRERIRMVEVQGKGIVFTTSFPIESPTLGGTGTWPIVEIPFNDQALVRAVRAAISRDSVGSESEV